MKGATTSGPEEETAPTGTAGSSTICALGQFEYSCWGED